MTAATWSCVASLRNPAAPFSGVPESSSTTSSILRPPRTPPRAFTSSTAILAPRTMNCPAAASPGGESGVSTPILTGFCAEAGAASAVATSASAASSANRNRPVMMALPGSGFIAAEVAGCYARGPTASNVLTEEVAEPHRARGRTGARIREIRRPATPLSRDQVGEGAQTVAPLAGPHGDAGGPLEGIDAGESSTESLENLPRRHLLAATDHRLGCEEREKVRRRSVERLDSPPESGQTSESRPQPPARDRGVGRRASPQSYGGEETGQAPLQEGRLRARDARAVARREDAGHAGLEICGARRDEAAARGLPFMGAAEQVRQLRGRHETEPGHDGVGVEDAGARPVHATGAIDGGRHHVADLGAPTRLDHRPSPSQRHPRAREPHPISERAPEKPRHGSEPGQVLPDPAARRRVENLDGGRPGPEQRIGD